MIALISDIHSNSVALKAVLQDIENFSVDNIYCLGDSVNGGNDPNGILDLLIKNNILCIVGNHEKSITDRENGNSWISESKLHLKEYTLKQITPSHIAFLDSLPLYRKINGLHFVHSVPPDYPKRKIRKELDEFGMIEVISRIDSSICFVGHSHKEVIYSSGNGDGRGYSRNPAVQLNQKKIDTELKQKSYTAGDHFLDRDKPYIINVGSVGLHKGDSQHASYCLFNEEKLHLIYRHIYFRG